MEEKLRLSFTDLQVVQERTNSILYKGKFHSSQKTYAIKYFKSKLKNEFANFVQEITFQRGLLHSNIMPIYLYDYNLEAQEGFYSMPFLESIESVIVERSQKPSIGDITKLVRDIAKSLLYVKNTEGIAHNNIHPRNIFYYRQLQKFVLGGWTGDIISQKDIPYEEEQNTAHLKEQDGTKGSAASIYKASELTNLTRTTLKDKAIYYKSDIYSLGMIALEFSGLGKDLLKGFYYASGDREFKEMQKGVRFHLNELFDHQELTNLLIAMTNRWRLERPSAHDIVAQIERLHNASEESPDSSDSSDEMIVNRNVQSIYKDFSIINQHLASQKIEVSKLSLNRKFDAYSEGIDDDEELPIGVQINDSIKKKSKWTNEESECEDVDKDGRHYKLLEKKIDCKEVESLIDKGCENYAGRHSTETFYSMGPEPMSPDYSIVKSMGHNNEMLAEKIDLINTTSKSHSTNLRMSFAESKNESGSKILKKATVSGLTEFFGNIGENISTIGQLGKKAFNRLESAFAIPSFRSIAKDTQETSTYDAPYSGKIVQSRKYSLH